MAHGDRSLGVLIVQSQHRGAFTTEDVELLSIIARQAAAAIDNARLFEAQRDEREMAEAAARIARVALSSTTAADAAAAILAILGDVVPIAGAAIGLLDRDDAIAYVAASGSVARPRAIRACRWRRASRARCCRDRKARNARRDGPTMRSPAAASCCRSPPRAGCSVC